MAIPITTTNRGISQQSRGITSVRKKRLIKPTDSIIIIIKIVGHASPRYKKALNRKHAILKNKRLASKRAKAALFVLKKIARAQFVTGAKLVFKHNISFSNPHNTPANVITETDSLGDIESLQRAKGDTNANDQFYRRVDATIQFSVRKLVDAGQSTVRIVQPTTREWEIAITGLAGGGVALGAAMVDFLLKNRKTNQVVKAFSTIIGGTTPDLAGGGSAQRGKEKWVFFKTAEPMNWDDFKNTPVTISHRGVDTPYGSILDKTTLSFTELGVNGLNLSGWAATSTPSVAAWVKSGPLKLTAPKEKKVAETEHDWTPTIESEEIYIPIYFDTGKSIINKSEINTLGSLVKQAAEKFNKKRVL